MTSIDQPGAPADYGFILAIGGASLVAIVGLVVVYLKSRKRE